MVVGAILFIFTLGSVIIYSGPIITIGILLFIVGLIRSDGKIILSYGELKTVQQPPKVENFQGKYTICYYCGKSIASNVKICPYCKNTLK